ncbi:MAG: hypothetical protein KBA61_01125 [Spirochaetes bacterium]|nr:hypothetical protein [Spirochaetota bacterium]
MIRAAWFILALLLCGVMLSHCSDDVEGDLQPVHVRVYNTDDVDFSIKIGDHDFGTVLKSTKSDYAEFGPLGSYAIIIDTDKAPKNLNTGSGGLYTLEIPDKGDIDTWEVTAD